jgi:hypothetical protein
MTDALPAPLVPAEVDLRDYDNFPLEFRRLFASETWLLGTPEEKLAAFCLWCESWYGTPASSLPDNERILAHLSQAGHQWPKLREHVMRGWVKCSDGRWYHPVVAEKALEAWAKHKKQSSKGKAGALKRWGTGIASATKNNGTGNAPAIPKNGTGIAQASKTDGTGNAPAIKKDSQELELEKKRKDFEPSLNNNDGAKGGESQGLESLPSTPTRRRRAVDIAASAAAKATGRG